MTESGVDDRSGVVFNGDTKSLYKLLIGNLIRVVFSLGIYAAWSSDRIKFYLFSNSYFGQDNIYYKGVGGDAFLAMFTLALVFFLKPFDVLAEVFGREMAVAETFLDSFLIYFGVAVLAHFLFQREARALNWGIQQISYTGSFWHIALRCLPLGWVLGVGFGYLPALINFQLSCILGTSLSFYLVWSYWIQSLRLGEAAFPPVRNPWLIVLPSVIASLLVIALFLTVPNLTQAVRDSLAVEVDLVTAFFGRIDGNPNKIDTFTEFMFMILLFPLTLILAVLSALLSAMALAAAVAIAVFVAGLIVVLVTRSFWRYCCIVMMCGQCSGEGLSLDGIGTLKLDKPIGQVAIAVTGTFLISYFSMGLLYPIVTIALFRWLADHASFKAEPNH